MIELIMCLALNNFHEARGEPWMGQVAVAEVVLERVRRKTWPDNGCDVIWQRKQFSWTIGYTHQELTPSTDIIEEALMGTNYSNGADHYHTIDMIPPDWSDDMTVVQVIGNHIFYRSTYE